MSNFVRTSIPQRKQAIARNICGFIRIPLMKICLFIAMVAVGYAFSAFLPWIDNHRPVEWARFWALGIAWVAVLSCLCAYCLPGSRIAPEEQ